MVLLSEKQQRDLLIAVGLGDFLVGGKLTALGKKGVVAAIKAMRPVVASEARGLSRLAARAVPAAARGLTYAARTNPYSLAATLAIAGYIKREEIADVARAVADDPRVQEVYEDVLAGGQAAVGTMREAAIHTYGPDLSGLSPGRGVAQRFLAKKRKVSRANLAVKQGMKWLKAGGAATTLAPVGKLPKQAFKMVVKAAGLANPKTKSKPGKGKSIINKLARRLKKWW